MPARAVRQPRGSRRRPPRVRLCPAAAPDPAPAPQGGSSNSPASDGEGETYCCFLSAAYVPQLAKCRLMKFHASAPACHPIPRLQPPPRTPGHPGLQEGSSGGKTEPREEPEPPLTEVGGKAPRGAGSPAAAARPGALPRLGAAVRRVPQSDRLSQPHGPPPRRCQLALGGSAPGRVSRLLPAAIQPAGAAHP